MTRDELLERYTAGERDFSGADLANADLTDAKLRGAKLAFADLTGATLTNATLAFADLAFADLAGATLTGATLTGTILTKANLGGAKLTNAPLRGAGLRAANLTDTVGLPDASAWIAAHLTRVEGGWLASKTFGAYYTPNPAWVIEPGNVLEDPDYDPDRCLDCAAGINCATRDWISRNALTSPRPAWRIFIADADIDAGDVCVPYATDGKFRARRVTLIGPAK